MPRAHPRRPRPTAGSPPCSTHLSRSSPDPDSTPALRAHFVEARLHSDARDPDQRADVKLCAEALAGSFGQPIYVALDPRNGAELARFEGFDQSGGEQFRAFLETALQRRL